MLQALSSTRQGLFLGSGPLDWQVSDATGKTWQRDRFGGAVRDGWRGEDACELDGAWSAENWHFWGLLGGIFEDFRALGGSWESLGGFLEPLGRHLGALEGSQAVI